MPNIVTIPRELPRPASHSWGNWLAVLTPSQLRAVHAWRRDGYNAMLSPKTCWYLLCGRLDPAEKAKRLRVVAEWYDKNADSGVSGAILGGSAPDQALALQNDGCAQQIDQEAA